MLRYLRPLGIFVMGQAFLLIVWLFFPTLGDAGTELAENTAGWASIGWGWSWAVGALRLLVVICAELMILFFTAKAFLSERG